LQDTRNHDQEPPDYLSISNTPLALAGGS